jgi:hypothetical protein
MMTVVFFRAIIKFIIIIIIIIVVIIQLKLKFSIKIIDPKSWKLLVKSN